ncbi:response regulator transcription factor [Oceanithermus sp.]
MKVLVVEDHVMVREALVRLIQCEIEDSQIREASTATEARRYLPWAERVVLDLSLPDLHDLKFLEQIRREYAALPVVVLTAFDEAAFRKRAAELGVSAFLSKEDASRELIAALREPDAGEVRVGGALEALSPTEREVLLLLGQGCSNREVADKLAMDDKTVYSHRRHLMFKLGLDGAQELLRYATLYYAGLD